MVHADSSCLSTPENCPDPRTGTSDMFVSRQLIDMAHVILGLKGTEVPSPSLTMTMRVGLTPRKRCGKVLFFLLF